MNLIFNTLTIEWPKEAQTCYFTLEEEGTRIFKSQFPQNIESIFPGVNSDGTEFIYTSFKTQREGFKSLSIDFQSENQDFLKRVYNDTINYYFKKRKNQLVKTNFIKDNQVWVHSKKHSTEKIDVYEKFTLKIQFETVSNLPELVLSYDGKSSIYKTSVADLIHDISPSKFGLVLYKNGLHKFDHLSERGVSDFENVFPLLNLDLKKALTLPIEAPPRDNRYIKYLDQLNNFVKAFINNDAFKSLVPISSSSFLSVPGSRVNQTEKNSNQLIFGNGKQDIVPNSGMQNYGPYKPSKWSKVHLFYIHHEDDIKTSLLLYKYFRDGLKGFTGLQQFAKVLTHTETGFSIKFTDKNNPIPEIERELQNRAFDPDVKYIAIYMSPVNKYDQDESKREIYYKVKELLLKRNITSQAIDPAKVISAGENYRYSLPNIAVAILAKLDGIPWRLDTPIKNELIVGIGAFKHVSTDIQYIGSAFSFDNKGGFNRFEYFMKHEIDILAGSISAALREYVSVNSTIDRLIIHFYKTMSEKELAPIEKALLELGLDIPVFIVTVNKTESEDIIAFDTASDNLMPLSGTYINIGESKYLLFNNTRYSNAAIGKSDGFPFPIKLKIDCTHKEQLKEVQVIKDLINQVYQFSRMYWKSVKQQNLPVTIKYPEMVAQIAPHFDGDEIPQYGKDNLWFL